MNATQVMLNGFMKSWPTCQLTTFSFQVAAGSPHAGSNRWVFLLDPPGTVEETVATFPFPFLFLFKTNPTLHRPGRRFPRHRRAGYRRAWFCRYTARTVA